MSRLPAAPSSFYCRSAGWFAINSSAVLDQAASEDVAALYRQLARELEGIRVGNEAAITPIRRAYTLGSAALVIEIVTLTLLSTGTIG
jgi:hypothetical protein